jgi:Predicted inhibitor of MCP methylation, homolog of CheC
MEQDKFSFFCDCFEEALKKVLAQLPDINLMHSDDKKEGSSKKLSSVVGVVGVHKGRIHIAMAEDLAKELYEKANGEPVGDEMDLCFYLAEFTNMLAGSGITVLNNTYKGINLRLTPPAIFADENLDIATPQVQSGSRSYTTKYGSIFIEIGFEGV